MILFLTLLIGFYRNERKRYDGSPSLPYYSTDELGIKEERFSFYSGKNRLYGSRYYEKETRYKGIIVFFHGIGAGRTAYLKLISVFAKAGYLVYAYDNTGCMESEGKGYIGLGHVNPDQNAFFRFLDSDPKAKGYTRYALGHSWGGYASLLSLRKEFHVAKAVSISGFLKPEREILAAIKKLQKGIFHFLGKLCIRLVYGKNGNIDAVDVIKNSEAKVLYIQGDKDTLVPFKTNGAFLEKELHAKQNVRFLFLKGRGHSPYLTPDAEKYSFSFFEETKKTIELENHPAMDIAKATALEKKVIQAIIDFLDKE